MRPWTICLLLSLLIGVSGLLSEADRSAPRSLPQLERVAHSGGAAGKTRYSNSAEAIESSLGKGFRFIEIDLVWTSDRHLVCLHDWGGTARWMLAHEGEPLDLAGFQEAAKRSRLTALTLEDLGELMREYPEMTLVTDPKSDNLEALALVKQTIPDAARRVAPQIFMPEEYAPAREMGYERVIWTLNRYRYQRNVDRVVEEASSIDVYAVCMPVARAKEGHALRLREVGVPSYVHTINDPALWKELRDEYGVSEMYTNFLAPERAAE